MAELTEKQNIRIRLWAAEELMKRYSPIGITWIKEKQDQITAECIETISNIATNSWQKKAARILLNSIYGPKLASDMIEGIALVSDRNDSLVFRWKRRVIKRDRQCVKCGSKENLQAHHISHWADDPVNRTNLENGVALCGSCHSSEHPELNINLFVRE